MTSPDFLFGIIDGDIIYDIEVYPNIFCIGLQHYVTGRRWYFEISAYRNDIQMFCKFLSILSTHKCRMVGFNNVGYDYPVIHLIFKHGNMGIGYNEIYNKSYSIIKSNGPAKFAHMVWESDHAVPQLDLFKIHHFDNMAKSTSLKMLEFNMRMNDIQDLPFKVGIKLMKSECVDLAKYMWHDIKATAMFYGKTLDQIRFREELTLKYDRNFLNHNDTKIGKDFFIMKLEEFNPGCCYSYTTGKKKIVQTPRESIDLDQIILPYVKFENVEFQRILIWFQSQVITETKGSITDVNCTIDGFQFDFGTGGIHGSVESSIVHSTEEMIIEDWDVASYYPNLAIQNNLYPEHLGQTFCSIYQEIYEQRKQHKKGTTENAMLKLALNGTYGDSNNQYSPFYDPKFTMSITINGQLSLCMLAEQLIKLDSLRMIQINTDGLTIRYPRQHQAWVHEICKWWEGVTKLELESAEYTRMMIRDCNNYIAEYAGGKLKRKGAYEYDLGWHQNHSALVVPRAAEAALVRGEDIREFIMNHDDVFDFFLRTKVPRNSRLEWGGETVQNIVRYYISTKGKTLQKVMPPAGPPGEYKRANKLTDSFYSGVMAEVGMGVWDERIHTKNKSKYETRVSGINTGWTVHLCNRVIEGMVKPDDLNYEWYVKETEKLVKPLMG